MTISSRKVSKIDDLVISLDEEILIIDIININSYLIVTHTGIYVNVDGALDCMSSSKLELVINCYTVATFTNNPPVLLKINQALLDTNPNQTEALLQPHQARAFGVAVDDCARRHCSASGKPGDQCITIGKDVLPLHFDGWKCYLHTRQPSSQEMKTLPVYELTSQFAYNPQSIKIRRVSTIDVGVEDWCARLGYPTYEVTQVTLKNTTQMIQTLQAESREYLRDYYKTRVRDIRPHMINDVMYSDTFFSPFRSVRGHTYFQLFAFKATKLTKSKIMRRESQAPEIYEDVIRHIGAPNKTVTDNAIVCTGKRWTYQYLVHRYAARSPCHAKKQIGR